ncbi:MAG: hypothetical protein ABI927_07185 [Gaiellaceae bacterium]
MAPRALSRTPVGLAFVVWRVWQRLPPSARRQALQVARKHGYRVATTHGPRLASLVAKRAAAAKRR